MKSFALSLGFGLGYYLLALLALPLAIPPGYSSPVWPAAAVAMVAFWRLGWMAGPSILAAATLVNAGPGVAGAGTLGIVSGVLIGCGTVIQGAAGGAIIKRLARIDARLADPAYFLKGLLLLGPCCCVISASIGVLSLYAVGRLPAELIASNWVTWWIGDALGVGLGLPALYMLFSPLRRSERSRVLLIVTLSAALTGIAIGVYLLALGRWKTDLMVAVTQEADEVRTDIQVVRNQYEAIVSSLDALLTTIPDLGPGEFQTFCAPLVENFSGIHALEWIPKVPASKRDEFEARMRMAGYPGFVISQRGRDGGVERAPDGKPFYFPVSYVWPVARNERAIGFDVSSNAVRREALLAAARTDRVTATRPVVLVQEDELESYSFLVFSPVMSLSNPPFAPMESVRGFVSGVFRMEDVIAAAVGRRRRSMLHFAVYDPRAPDIAIYSDPGAVRASSGAGTSSGWAGALGARSAFTRVTGDDTEPWLVKFYLAKAAYSFGRWWPVWLTLVVGALCTFMFVAFATTTTARPEEIRRIVDERTHELSLLSEELKGLNESLERRIEERTEELKEANAALGEFAFAASHDLRAPLRKLQMFLDVLKQEVDGGRLSTNADLAVSAIESSTVSMLNLVCNLSAIYRSGKSSIECTAVAIDDVVDDVLEILDAEIAASDAVVSRVPLPVVKSERALLTAVYQNIVSNALKFRREEVRPLVDLSWRAGAESNEVILVISDNGIGIPGDRREEIFWPLKRLHAELEYPGSGMGLAVCRRILDGMDQRLWIEDSSLGGTRFCFTQEWLASKIPSGEFR